MLHMVPGDSAFFSVDGEVLCIASPCWLTGVLIPPNQLTEDGLEITYAVNHYGHLYLTHLLLPKLRESAPSRVVHMSSGLEAFSSPGWGPRDLRCGAAAFRHRLCAAKVQNVVASVPFGQQHVHSLD
jgi:NAD(P)-dependent dehydrogenase (short-subunit alcohol dehydrogenase family)